MSMKKVFEQDSYHIYNYKPTIFKPLYNSLEKITIRRKIRLMIALYYGYSVYYLKKDNNYIGYCLVQSGKDHRYTFSSSDDIIVGPYFISENYRGRKYSAKLLNYILKDSQEDYKFAYDYINKKNIPSIKVTESVGFKLFSEAVVSKYRRAIILTNKDKGNYLIYKYENY